MAEMPFDPGAFADTPLFREIQRVLASSSGPVNWELARQIGIASAQDGRQDDAVADDDRREFEEAVRLAELHVARFTGLSSPSDVAPVRAVRRAEWVNENTGGLRSLIEPAAARIGAALGELAREALPEEAKVEMVSAPILEQLSPLLLGAQVGTVLGFLGQRVLGQYDVAVPRGGQAQLLFVVANISAFEHDWSLDRTDFRTYIALHEVTHRFEFARPWAHARFQDLLGDFLSTIEFDVAALREKLATLDAANAEALQEMFEGDQGLFGAVLDDEQRIKQGRIQSFMAAAEGYGDHVAHAIGRELLPTHPQIEEAMSRLGMGNADPVFERLLGIEMKREQYEQGRTFCDTVVEATDEFTLARMWDGPDAMPSLPEVEEPRLWLARTV